MLKEEGSNPFRHANLGKNMTNRGEKVLHKKTGVEYSVIEVRTLLGRTILYMKAPNKSNPLLLVLKPNLEKEFYFSIKQNAELTDKERRRTRKNRKKEGQSFAYA